ncbi:unnamed protein product, partial [Notodromas monacha]
RLIVKEWAKLKYGVFDETHRSASDPSSPSYYTPFGISGPEEPVPTRCSNIPVKGHRNCVGPTCHFLPLDKVAENDGVVSSLMSYPDLPQNFSWPSRNGYEANFQIRAAKEIKPCAGRPSDSRFGPRIRVRKGIPVLLRSAIGKYYGGRLSAGSLESLTKNLGLNEKNVVSLREE